ncbi:MAG: DNA recombination protein RmuC [Ilumatobacteraceae bacterium]
MSSNLVQALQPLFPVAPPWQTKDVELLVGLLIVCVIAVGVLLVRRQTGVPATLVPGAPVVDQMALVDAVRTAVDAQIRQVTQEALSNANDQVDRLYQARSQTLTSDTKTLLDPVATQLQELRSAVTSLQSSYDENKGLSNIISTQISQLTDTTAALHGALKSSSARGAWGEQQLRNVIELAGMESYCDFDEQTTLSNNDRLQRPDAVVRLPNNSRVVIDAKTPLDAYLRAQEAPDTASQQHFLQDHAKSVRDHARVLADKKYWTQFDRAPEYVIMFIPGESFLSDALRADPTLLEVAMRSRVLIASPVNLLALLLAVAKGWQAFQIAEHAEKIAQLGKELYERVDTVLEHVDKTGRGLETAIKAYNSMVGSMESRVLPTLRKFKETGIAVGEVEDLKAIDTAPRQLSAPELNG